ncbi:hypothetical protein ACYPKM_00460 [Pseudomonas aeruginosa]
MSEHVVLEQYKELHGLTKWLETPDLAECLSRSSPVLDLAAELLRDPDQFDVKGLEAAYAEATAIYPRSRMPNTDFVTFWTCLTSNHKEMLADVSYLCAAGRSIASYKKHPHGLALFNLVAKDHEQLVFRCFHENWEWISPLYRFAARKPKYLGGLIKAYQTYAGYNRWQPERGGVHDGAGLAHSELRNFATYAIQKGFFHKVSPELAGLMSRVRGQYFHSPLGDYLKYAKAKWSDPECKDRIKAVFELCLLPRENIGGLIFSGRAGFWQEIDEVVSDYEAARDGRLLEPEHSMLHQSEEGVMRVLCHCLDAPPEVTLSALSAPQSGITTRYSISHGVAPDVIKRVKAIVQTHAADNKLWGRMATTLFIAISMKNADSHLQLNGDTDKYAAAAELLVDDVDIGEVSSLLAENGLAGADDHLAQYISRHRRSQVHKLPASWKVFSMARGMQL